MEKLIKLSHLVSKYCVGMEGNVSMKTDTGLIIKTSGSKLSNLHQDDLVRYNFSGEQLDNFEKKGSMELGFHTFLLQQENINFIAHTHPTNTLKILCSQYTDSFANNRLFPDQVVFNGKKSCIVPYAKPGNELTEVIKTQVNLFLKINDEFPKLILLKNHGIIACGKTIEECLIISEICEKAAEIFIGSKLIGNMNFLPTFQVNSLIFDEKEKYRKSLL
jgi:ribulose-5-phosphate 4-epimerase/fuculose-1-phosphate aldolase